VVRDAVRSQAPHARTLLDVACGTRKHLEYLRASHEADGTRVVCVSNFRIEGKVSLLGLRHVVCTGGEIEHVAETHRITLFTYAEFEAAFRAAGMP
jgi:hypothetical protein